jgi:anthranilate synthase/aminodeoxychorismate synthase-like glutamine amidotransferase
MLLLLDNYDSFIYNLAQYFGELGCEVVVRRNDQVTLDEIATMAPSHICISPGPCTPRQAGLSNEVIQRFGPQIPMLGVCLGHQCIAEVYGGKVVRSPQLVHGKSSAVHHQGGGLFASLTTPFVAGRYHSLMVESDSLPSSLEVIARSDGNEIMALRHREFPVHGVQFHPESILTPDGKTILTNFLNLSSQ